MAEDSKECICMQEPLSEEEMTEQLQEIIDEYVEKPGGLIPTLQIAQSRFGYLSKGVLKKISVDFGKPYSEVAGVVSFYSFFSTVPRGKYVVRACLGTACYVRGGKEVLDSLKNELGIDVGETTEDKLFSLEVGRCFGACGLAPVILVNDKVHQRIKPSKIAELISQYKAHEVIEGEKVDE